MTRMFVAVWPPPAVTDLVDALPRVAVDGVRWTTPDQWHITLRFLGDVDEGEVATRFAEIDGRSVEAVVGPRVERLGEDLVIAPVAGLEALARDVDSAVDALASPRHPGGFRGHLTLARLKRPQTLPVDEAPIAAAFAVHEIALVRSELRTDGARYTTVTTRALLP